MFFRVHPLIKIICLFAAGLGGFPNYLHMTNLIKYAMAGLSNKTLVKIVCVN